MSSEMVPLSKSLVTDVALEFLLPLPLHRVKLAFMVRPGIKKGIGERYMQSILIWDGRSNCVARQGQTRSEKLRLLISRLNVIAKKKAI